MSEAPAPVGHNLPPLTTPDEATVIANLEATYPTVKKDLAELKEAAKTYPPRITDDETAGALQALLKKATTHKSSWKAWRGEEKKPWDRVAKIVFNWFSDPEDQVEKLIADLKPRYTAFLEMKAEKERLEREAKAEAERKEAERLEAERLAAEKRKAEAEEAERQANLRAEEARKRAEEEKRKQEEAEARAAAAKAEADRIDRERKERDKAEKEENASNIRSMKQFMRTASALATEAETGTLVPGSEADTMFDDLIMEGGEIGRMGSKLLHSDLLDDEQRGYAVSVRDTLVGWRAARTQRMEAAEAERRRKADFERQGREAKEAEARAAQRKADEDAAAKARADRAAAEKEAEEAKARAKAATVEIREAAKDARGAYADQKEAAKDEKVLGRQVDKVEARADRMERRNESATDADLSRTRGEYGTTGSLTGAYEVVIKDRNALVAYFGPLGMYLKPDAVNAAVWWFMREHMKDWTAESVEDQVPGVTFLWVPDSRIS